MPRYLYVMEGEIEEKFINAISRMGLAVSGKTEVFNLMQQRMKSSSGLLTMRYDRVFCIIDTDVLNTKVIDNLIHNLELLVDISAKPIFILVQNKNFEHELCYMASVKYSLKNLEKLLGLKRGGLADIKRFLAQKADYAKLKDKVQFCLYCTRGEFFREEVIKAGKKFPKKSSIQNITKCK